MEESQQGSETQLVAEAHQGRVATVAPDDDGENGLDATKFPLSLLSLTARLPSTGIYRSLSRMRQTVNKYCIKLAEPRFYMKMHLGTVHSFMRRFEKKVKDVSPEVSVEMQIALKQLEHRVVSFVNYYKSVKAFNDTHTEKSLDAASEQLAPLLKFLEVGIWIGLAPLPCPTVHSNHGAKITSARFQMFQSAPHPCAWSVEQMLKYWHLACSWSWGRSPS